VRLDDQRGLGAADVQVGQRKQVTRRQQSNQPVHEIAHAVECTGQSWIAISSSRRIRPNRQPSSGDQRAVSVTRSR